MPKPNFRGRKAQVEADYQSVVSSSNPPKTADTIRRFQKRLDAAYKRHGKSRLTVRGDVDYDVYLALCWRLGNVKLVFT